MLYGRDVKVERHWWNGDRSIRGRRDVYVSTDGESWEVEAQVGGGAGRSKVYRCLGRQSAEILAGAWMGGQLHWQLVEPGRAASLPSVPDDWRGARAVT